jgi:membrane protease YdiL (CAAX protease family)
MSNRFIIASVVLVIYLAIIMVGAKLQVGENTMAQGEMISRQISISLVVGVVFLFAVVGFFGWWRDAGLRPVRNTKSLLVLWLPALLILGFFSVGLLLGYPPLKAFVFVGINTLIVGISEELAFRGIFFSGARSAMRPWPAIAITSFVFGAVHVLNGITTGDWAASTTQAIAAAMSGVLFIAILIRTGSIIPGMIVHWLWDFGVFSISTRAGRPVAPTEPLEPTMTMALMPILFVLPNFLFGLWLLRGIGSKSSDELLD